MSVKSLLFALGCVHLVAITTLANDQNTSKFKRVICIIPDHDKFFSNHSCHARPVNRNTTLLNMRAYLYRQVDTMTVNIRLYKKYIIYKPFLINVKENVCDFFTRKTSVPYTRLMMRVGSLYTNFNHTCPYIGELIVTNASLDARKLLDFWPSGEYRVDLIAMMNNCPSPSITIQFYFEIEEKLFG